VAFVLLIGCVNIANLMMARSQVRMTELATRVALGAERARLARQILTESIVIGILGGGLGVGVGALGLRALGTLGVDQLPRGSDVSIDGPVLLFALVVAVGASVLFGALPAARVMRSDLSSVFRAEGRTGTASRRAVVVRSSLVATQVAVAFVMLIGAGLMFMSFRAALAVNPGFDPKGVLTAYVSLPGARYGTDDARRQFTDELLGAVRALPGVEAASVTTNLPLTGNNSASVILPEGYVPRAGESVLAPVQSWAGPGYFKAMGIPLLEGRTFEESDGPDQPRAIVIDQWLAHRYWPNESPIGHRMVWGQPPGQDSIPPQNLFTIVGVVRDVKQHSLTEPSSEHVGAYYFTYRQDPPSGLALVVRTATAPGGITSAVRDALKRIDPEIPLFGAQTMEARLSDSLSSRRLPLMLLVVFAGVALFLAVVGIYGALAYSVTQRTREIGIRVAMGSTPGGVFRIVVGQGMRVAGIGLVVGAVASLLLTRFMSSLLFDVSPSDPWVLGGVALTLGAVALAACVVPARRATSVDPVTALTWQ
jgi:predicted permease